MKTIITCLFLAVTSMAFCQQKPVHAIKDYASYGYIDGIRLDSLKAAYARIGFRDRSAFFDYGQGTRPKAMIVTDQHGRRYYYGGNGNADSDRIFWMNFFYHNGWEYVPDSTFSLYKKRQNP